MRANIDDERDSNGVDGHRVITLRELHQQKVKRDRLRFLLEQQPRRCAVGMRKKENNESYRRR